jgi:type IV pilus assembly protein PilE
MVALAIMGILAAVAYPAYLDYVRRGQLAEAPTQLSMRRADMETWFRDNRTYVGAACNEEVKNFMMSCPTLTATTYTIQAQGLGPVAEFRYTVDQDNVQATTAAPAGWTTCGTKWIMKKGETC